MSTLLKKHIKKTETPIIHDTSNNLNPEKPRNDLLKEINEEYKANLDDSIIFSPIKFDNCDNIELQRAYHTKNLKFNLDLKLNNSEIIQKEISPIQMLLQEKYSEKEGNSICRLVEDLKSTATQKDISLSDMDEIVKDTSELILDNSNSNGTMSLCIGALCIVGCVGLYINNKKQEETTLSSTVTMSAQPIININPVVMPQPITNNSSAFDILVKSENLEPNLKIATASFSGGFILSRLLRRK